MKTTAVRRHRTRALLASALGLLAVPLVAPAVASASSGVPAKPALLQAQQRLADLGYLPAADADGQLGPETTTAVLAFQKWEGLARDGKLGPRTIDRLRTAVRPVPITQGGAGKRVEVLLDRQVALAIRDDQVVRVVPVSTGKASTPTPPGSFKVYAKYPRWWSNPFQEYLLWALPFNAGIALHQFPDVPAYAASHGCVREDAATARWMYDFGFVGMRVKVLARS
jgi:lipoprotein-anchoring transpeptidase ErfK/SrfK